MAKRFQDKSVIVTGGGSGIGRATAQAFAAEGARVLVVDWNEEAAETVAADIRGSGAMASACKADVSSYGDCEAMVREAVARHGGLHICFNNAGIGGPMIHKVHETTLDDWNRTIAVNLSGVFHCIKAQVPAMLESGGGAIINTSSVAGLVAGPNLAAYASAKHGVIGLTKAAAVDLIGNGIRVNCICPGATETAMLASTLEHPELREHLEGSPIGRIADPMELARTVLFLASDEASFIVGHALTVDGGVVLQ